MLAISIYLLTTQSESEDERSLNQPTPCSRWGGNKADRLAVDCHLSTPEDKAEIVRNAAALFWTSGQLPGDAFAEPASPYTRQVWFGPNKAPAHRQIRRRRALTEQLDHDPAGMDTFFAMPL